MTISASRAIVCALVIAALTPSVSPARECDAACLRSHIDRYLSALVAKQPSRLHDAAGIRYTENGAVLKVGEGLWKGASGLGDYRQYFADVVSQQAMFMGTVKENDAPVLLSLRVKVASDSIAEAEHIVARKGSHPLFAPESFVRPHAALSTPVSDRLPRERLIAIADSYFEGIERHDSRIVEGAETCQRIENGVQTTNQPGRQSRNCAHSADLLTYIKHVNERRFPIVDPVHGIVVSTFTFDIPGETPSSGSASNSAVAAAQRAPRVLLLTEWFKIENAKIQHIEAIMHNLPYGSHSGWK